MSHLDPHTLNIISFPRFTPPLELLAVTFFCCTSQKILRLRVPLSSYRGSLLVLKYNRIKGDYRLRGIPIAP